MNQLELEALIRRNLDDFYQRRIKKLSELKLSAVLRKKNLYLLCAAGVQKASEIVEEALKAYISSSDETIIGDAFWEELTDDPNFYQKIIALMRDYPREHRTKFEEEWAKAVNRFEHDFLNNFGKPDGSIDWEKLLRFNSGKEKVVWISKVAPVAVSEVQDEDEDEDDSSDYKEE